MRRSILQRRSRRKIKKDFELPLTSMMDMLIILLVFLLKSYASNAVAIATSPNIKLPTSSSEELPGDAANLIVDQYGITIDGEKVAEFKGVAPNTPADKASYIFEPGLVDQAGRRIRPVYDSLTKIREKAELLLAKTVVKDKDGNVTRPKFHGTLVIHADKSVRYELLRKIMYTAGSAEYRIFKLLTSKKDAGI
jgi:biopolymer transport protein ExbD